ncbi:MAG: hypothetical protein KDA24_20710 [Deltaproteobacteria bacterium]|nr:hypothetical protein [Deltaproteobacteria bacterium]
MLDSPLPHLLQAGGDHRLVVHAETGASQYRVAAQPGDTIPFGSCTASSPSTTAFGAAETLHQHLRASDDPGREIERATLRQRKRLAALFELPDDARIVLTPSGTDVIYLVSLLALRTASRVHHLVVGASELGGGTMRAARGLAISDVAPFGPSETGAPLAGLSEHCTAEPLYLREGDGAQVDAGEVDDDLRRAGESAPPDAALVLHLVAHSKTGLRAPTTAVSQELQAQLGGRLIVIVDGAQGRLAPRDVRRALKLGFAVLVTGSKFYSGPPFSSALVLPGALAGDPGPLPASLSDWFSRDGLPRSWTEARASLREPVNAGLALRWEAALAEIDRYHDVAPRHRAGVYHTFAGAVHEVFGPSPVLELAVPMPPMHRLVTALGAFPSVFCFRVRGPDGYLDKAALGRLHVELDTDRGDEHPALARRFHLGQPVPLGPPEETESAVLRVALGARLVSDLGPTPDAGGAWLRETLSALRRKTEHLVNEGLA